MTVKNSDDILKEKCELKVVLRSGASIVNTRPLFTQDSKCLIASSGSDVKVYSIQSGECIHTLRFHKTPIISLQDNKKNHLQVYSCSEDGVVVRWDYSEGKILKVYKLHMLVKSFYAPTHDGPWFISRRLENEGRYKLYSVTPRGKKKNYVQPVFKPVLPKENTVSFGFKGSFLASIYENTLSVYKFDSKCITRHKTAKRNLECVVCHSSDYIVATGDSTGRVHVWSNIFSNKNVIRSIYHWHTLPVRDLAFSPEGSYLYSGGGEAVLVKWNLFAEERSFVPRLGSPICHVNVSHDNNYVLTAHEDNALQVINSQRTVVQIIQGLTQGYFQGASKRTVLPTGLLYDFRTKALVLNGKPGHLQFYNVYEDKQLFNLDISSRNFISQERESVILNTDVQKAAVDDNGYWLATAEFWNDEETSPQIWLKFWHYDLSKQTFVLNTDVFLPHNREVNCIKFKPYMKGCDPVPVAVTTSRDYRFKIWSLMEDDCFDDKQMWSCESMGCYRDLPAGDACFSEEGSLLAVAFGSVATLWAVDDTTLKAVLCRDKTEANIIQLMFGKLSCSHLLVCHDGSSVTVWNVLTLSITWILHTEVQTLAGDMASEFMALFHQDQNIAIFKPNNPSPVFSMKSVSKTPVISAVFVENNRVHTEMPECFHEKSQLYFFNQDQNLLTLTNDFQMDSGIDDSNKISISYNLPMTPFGMLQAEHKVSCVKTVDPQPIVFNKDVEFKQNFEISNPTYADPLVWCSKILTSLLIPKPKQTLL